MKKYVLVSLIILCNISCKLFENNYCSNYTSDDNFFRTSANASSTNPQLAAEKSLLIAKQQAGILIDKYILEKYNHKLFLEDADYEKKINTARKIVLNNINIICSHQTHRKGLYYDYIAIEIAKKDIENEVQKRLNEKTR